MTALRTRIGCIPLSFGDDAVFQWTDFHDEILGPGYVRVMNGEGVSICDISFRDRQAMLALRACLDGALNKGEG